MINQPSAFFIRYPERATHSEMLFGPRVQNEPCESALTASTTDEPIFTTRLPNTSASALRAAALTPLASSPPQMLQNLERAAEHLDMTEDLAAVLSTTSVTVEHRTITGVEID